MVDLEPQVIQGPAPERRRRLTRLAFWIYAAILFTGTHWPNLKSPGPEGSDKIIHIGAFGTWMLLATAYGWFGRPLSDRNILRTLLLAGAYAATDEGLQAIPFVHRTAALDDYAANCIGIMLAALALLLLRHRLEKRSSADAQP
jgi:VanZ family protein